MTSGFETVASKLAELRKYGGRVRLDHGEPRFQASDNAMSHRLIADLESRKNDVSAFLRAKDAATRPIVTATGFHATPSFLQEQWWRWVSRLESEECHFPELTIQILVPFKGVSPQRVESAIRSVIARHDCLRYRFFFEEGTLRVHLNAAEDFEIRHVSRKSLRPETPEREEGDFRRAFFAQPVPANGRWLAKAAIVEEHDEVCALMIVNHIVADATSNRMIEMEIRRHVLDEGNIAPPARQYADYVNWERSWFAASGPILAGYWRGRGKHPALRSPSTGRQLQWAPGRKESCKAFLPFIWSGEVRRIARQLHTTPFLVYLTALAVSVFEWSGQDRFLMRNIGDGRLQNSALLPIVGLLTVADPIEAKVAPGAVFEATLRNLEVEYRAALNLRLPDIHAFAPGFGAIADDGADIANNFAVNINYMPRNEKRLEQAVPGAEDVRTMTWPPKIFRSDAGYRQYSVSPIHLFVTEGNTYVAIDFKMHADMLSPADRSAIVHAFFDCLRAQSARFSTPAARQTWPE